MDNIFADLVEKVVEWRAEKEQLQYLVASCLCEHVLCHMYVKVSI